MNPIALPPPMISSVPCNILKKKNDLLLVLKKYLLNIEFEANVVIFNDHNWLNLEPVLTPLYESNHFYKHICYVIRQGYSEISHYLSLHNVPSQEMKLNLISVREKCISRIQEWKVTEQDRFLIHDFLAFFYVGVQI